MLKQGAKDWISPDLNISYDQYSYVPDASKALMLFMESAFFISNLSKPIENVIERIAHTHCSLVNNQKHVMCNLKKSEICDLHFTHTACSNTSMWTSWVTVPLFPQVCGAPLQLLEGALARPLSCGSVWLIEGGLHLKQLRGLGGGLLRFIHSPGTQSEAAVNWYCRAGALSPSSFPMVAVMNDYSQRQALAHCLSVCLSYECCFAQIAVTII